MTYAEKLLDIRWQKKRLEIFNRDNWTCQLCGDIISTLHVHHKIYSSSNPWDSKNEELISYCEPCHWLIEDCKTTGMSVIKVEKAICKNGDSVLYSLIDECGELGYFIMITDYSKIEKRPIKNTIIIERDISLLFSLINKYNELSNG